MLRNAADFAKVMAMPCREHAAIISRLTGDPAAFTPGLRAGLWLHERYCTGCKAYHRQLTTLHKAIVAFAESETPQPAAATNNSAASSRPADRCPPEVLARIRTRLSAR